MSLKKEEKEGWDIDGVHELVMTVSMVDGRGMSYLLFSNTF